MIMTAREAREYSLEYIGGDDKKKLEEISEKVIDACREGKYSCSGKGRISENLVHGLRNLGYEVKVYIDETYLIIWDKYYEE